MIKNCTYIILFIILIVFLLVVFFLFGSKNMKRNYNPTLIVGEDTVWTYQNKKWSNVNLNKKEKRIGRNMKFILIMKSLDHIIYGMMINGIFLIIRRML